MQLFTLELKKRTKRSASTRTEAKFNSILENCNVEQFFLNCREGRNSLQS